MHMVMIAVKNSNRPIVTNGKKYPPNEYREPPTIGPTIKPSPKNVSSEANVTLTLSGNSFAMIANEAVKNAALPNASMIRMIKANVINSVCPYLWYKENKMKQLNNTNISHSKSNRDRNLLT